MKQILWLVNHWFPFISLVKSLVLRGIPLGGVSWSAIDRTEVGLWICGSFLSKIPQKRRIRPHHPEIATHHANPSDSNKQMSILMQCVMCLWQYNNYDHTRCVVHHVISMCCINLEFQFVWCKTLENTPYNMPLTSCQTPIRKAHQKTKKSSRPSHSRDSETRQWPDDQWNKLKMKLTNENIFNT